METRKAAAWTVVVACCAIGNALLLQKLFDPGYAVDGVASANAASDARPRSDLKLVDWHDSTAVGLPNGGSLVNGVMLPRAGHTFVTWDLDREHSPNRSGHRWATGELVRTLLHVLAEYARDHPVAPPLVVGDLSLERGGFFGHLSHQNGTDVDVYYPRTDGALRPPETSSDIDRRLAQDLVDRFVRAGAEYVFIGPSTGLTGPRKIVEVWAGHDQHMHVRIPNPDTASPSTPGGN